MASKNANNRKRCSACFLRRNVDPQKTASQSYNIQFARHIVITYNRQIKLCVITVRMEIRYLRLPHFKMILTPITFLLEYSLLSLLEKPHSSTGRALGSNLIQVCNKYAELHMLASSRTNKIAQLNKNGDACIFRRLRLYSAHSRASALCVSRVRLRVRIFRIHLNLMMQCKSNQQELSNGVNFVKNGQC